MSGQIPVRMRRAKARGQVTLLKKGAATVIFSPWIHSERIGNTVPQKIAKQIETNNKLLKRNVASLERKDLIRSSLCN